jgi:hypothetical protein
MENSFQKDNNGWYSVKDVMPTNGSKVIVCSNLGCIKIAQYYDAYYGFSGSALFTKRITHWRPLPPLPNKEQK